jgi:SNF2 family DNA or RNA helicase
MGCGKTLTAIAIAGRLFLDGKVKRLLVVAPTSVVSVWPKEFAEYAAFQHSCVPLEGDAKKRIKALNETAPGLDVKVINYEATWRMIESLIAWSPDMIICDESQRIKTASAKQSKAMHKLGDQAKYKLILTGTPVQNAPLDFWSQYRFLDKNIFGNSYYAFKTRHAVMGGYGNYQVLGYRDLGDLTRKAHSIAYRITKADALDLPPETDETRHTELEPEAKRVYKQIARESYAEIESGEVTAANILTRLLRLSQITGGYLNTDEGRTHEVSRAKLSALEELLEDVVLGEEKKLVIFARFVSEIAAIRKLIQSKGIQYAWIAGEIKMEDRGEMVRSFQEEPEIKVFIAQIQTAGLGITLTAADTAVFYSLDFNFANYSQARARIHRIGQRSACTYIHLIAPGTVDEKIMEALASKEDMARRVVDDWRSYFKP